MTEEPKASANNSNSYELFLLFVCVYVVCIPCVYMAAYVWVHVHIGVTACGGREILLGTLFSASFTLLGKADSHRSSGSAGLLAVRIPSAPSEAGAQADWRSYPALCGFWRIFRSSGCQAKTESREGGI